MVIDFAIVGASVIIGAKYAIDIYRSMNGNGDRHIWQEIRDAQLKTVLILERMENKVDEIWREQK